MKVLVTGGAGFIGANFVYHMLEKYPDYKDLFHKPDFLLIKVSKKNP